jgi:hypothetical protein
MFKEPLMSVRHIPARRTLAALALATTGVAAGGLATLATTANADPTPTPSASSSSGAGGRTAETALTGDTLAKVKDAVLAKYPGATFNRVETDSDGVYEAHITTSAGDNITVELNKDYAITGTE